MINVRQKWLEARIDSWESRSSLRLRKILFILGEVQGQIAKDRPRSEANEFPSNAPKPYIRNSNFLRSSKTHHFEIQTRQFWNLGNHPQTYSQSTKVSSLWTQNAMFRLCIYNSWCSLHAELTSATPAMGSVQTRSKLSYSTHILAYNAYWNLPTNTVQVILIQYNST